jgi:4-amino-4-deoxy-L-arabinose transferase-like glycosyltransferase
MRPTWPRGAGRFHLLLGAIAGVGFFIRVLWTHTHGLVQNGLLVDQTYYHRVANFVANGDGYINPAAFDAGFRRATADKPPLYPLALALETKLGGGGVDAHRYLGALLGTATIVMLGLLARHLGGNALGLLVAALGALNPQLWVVDSQMLSETLYGPLLVLVLLLAYRLREQPSLRRGAALGAALGLATLTRPEGIAIGVLIGLVLLWKQRRLALPGVAMAAAVCVLLIAPWSIRNWIVFDRPVFLSQQSAENVGGANCDAAYYGRDIGLWRVDCLKPVLPLSLNEAVRVAAVKKTGTEYIKDHLARVPVVVLARIGRSWGFFRPHTATLERVVGWVLLVLALIGGWVAARRRGVAVGILLVPAVVVTLTSAAQFGWLRYRYSTNLAFLVLAGFAVLAAYDWARARPGRGAAVDRPAHAQEASL